MKRKDKDCGTCPECGVWSPLMLDAGVCIWCDHIIGVVVHKTDEESK